MSNQHRKYKKIGFESDKNSIVRQSLTHEITPQHSISFTMQTHHYIYNIRLWFNIFLEYINYQQGLNKERILTTHNWF